MECGDRRADFLRLENELAKLPVGEERYTRLKSRLGEVGRGIDEGWVAAVSRIAIENCGVSFRYRCPKRWEHLQPTADESERFCEACRRKVYFCSTLVVAQTHAALGDCVAVDPRLLRKPNDLESNLWALDVVGMPGPDEWQPGSKGDESAPGADATAAFP